MCTSTFGGVPPSKIRSLFLFLQNDYLPCPHLANCTGIMKLIEHIIEPKKLLVLWQAIDGAMGKATGDRFIVGEISNNGASSTLTYYDNADTKNAATKGFKGLTSYPFEPNKIYNGNVEAVLAKRLPPDTRGDYEDFLRAYRISPAAAKEASPLALLANTTGNLMGDGFGDCTI